MEYQLTKTGVRLTATGAGIPHDIGNKDWQTYLQWVKDGNTPDPIQAEVVPTIEDEYDNLSDWLKEVIKETGANVTAFKAKVAARRNRP